MPLPEYPSPKWGCQPLSLGIGHLQLFIIYKDNHNQVFVFCTVLWKWFSAWFYVVQPSALLNSAILRRKSCRKFFIHGFIYRPLRHLRTQYWVLIGAVERKHNDHSETAKFISTDFGTGVDYTFFSFDLQRPGGFKHWTFFNWEAKIVFFLISGFAA